MLVLLRTTIALVATLGVIVFSTAIFSQEVHAADISKFRADNLIDDSVFQNKNTMSVESIQNFLDSKNSVCLKSYNTPSIDGNNSYGGSVSAARAIKQAADLWDINPQVLLVTMQKENSLITRTNCPSYVYTTSLGVGCPDTAACDSQYFGLSRQLYQGARWLRNYFNQTPGWYTLRPGVNYIQYNPNSGCGGTNLNIINRATAALYTFTPYQPNSAALAAGYGTGNSCSAYGNRNFWLYFTDWFGTTYAGDAVYAVADNGDSRQWVIHNGIRYHVPTVDVINAWGLGESQPLVRLSASYLGSFAEGSHLSNSIRDTTNGWEYLVDSGTKYHYTTGAQETAWRADQRTSYPRSLINTYLKDGGDLGYAIKFKDEPAIYMVDDGVLRQYSSIQLLRTIESIGSVEVNQSLKSRFTTGTSIDTNKFEHNSTKYFVDTSRKMRLNDNYTQLYSSGQTQVVSLNTLERLTTINSTYFVKARSSDAVYLVDSGQKRHVSSIELLRAYAKDREIPSNIITILSDDAIQSFLPTGSPLTSAYASSNGKKYIIDGKGISVESSLQSAYIGSNATSNGLSAALIDEIGEVGANRFVTDNSGKYYYIDGSNKRWIKNLETYISLSGSDRSLTKLSDGVFNAIGTGDEIDTPFVKDSDGGMWYLSGDTKYSINTNHQKEWASARVGSLSSTTLSAMQPGGEVSNSITVNNIPYLVNNGKLYKDNRGYMPLWTGDQSKSFPVSLLNHFQLDGVLTRFAKSTNPQDGRIFAKDKDKLIHISTIAALQNFAGNDSLETIPITPSKIQASSVVGSSLVSVQMSDGTFKSVIAGKIHSFATDELSQKWKTNDTVGISNELVAALGTASTQTNSVVVKAVGKDEIYVIENGIRRWVYYTPYVMRYIQLPVTTMNATFVQAYPLGAAIIN